MFRNLTANLILHERVETTVAKAKELRRVAEKLLTKAIRLGNVAYGPSDGLSAADRARRVHIARLVAAFIGRFATRTLPGGTHERVDLVEKVLRDLAKRFGESTHKGGYTRITRLGPRRGDGAEMSVIEWVVNEGSATNESAAS
jgi:large subunit ribosomal protein L17